MKIYNNLLFSILDKIEPWNDITTSEKESMLSNLLETKKKPEIKEEKDKLQAINLKNQTTHNFQAKTKVYQRI